jgi:hypothetical protein
LDWVPAPPEPVGVVEVPDVFTWVGCAPAPRAKTWLALALNAAAARSSTAVDNGFMVASVVLPITRIGSSRRSDPDVVRGSPAGCDPACRKVEGWI